MSNNSGLVRVDMAHPDDGLQYGYEECSPGILSDMGWINNYILK